MKISRRAVCVGFAASAISSIAPPFADSRPAPATAGAAREAVGGSARELTRNGRDLTLDNSWLVQLKRRSANLVIHEPTGAMFRPDVSGELAFAGVWADYAPAYLLPARDARGGLVQIAPPGSPRSSSYARADAGEIQSAARRVAAACEAAKSRGRGWMRSVPCVAGGAAIKVLPPGARAGGRNLSFPAELQASIPAG